MHCEIRNVSQRGEKRRRCHLEGPSGSSNFSKEIIWVADEETLQNAIQLSKEGNCKDIAKILPSKTDMQCSSSRRCVIDANTVKGKWTKEEDEMLIQLVNKLGPGNWSRLAKAIPGRGGKQCRDRWLYQLDPSINKEPWTEEEEIKLFQAYQMYGPHWCKMTKFFSGRPPKAIKVHWTSTSMSKKLDMYKAMLEDSVSSVSVPNFCDKNNGEGISAQDENNIKAASEAGALISQATTDLCSNSTLIDELSDKPFHEAYNQCSSSQRVIDANTVKGRWTKEEDEMLIQMINKMGHGKWSLIAKAIPGRGGKQCRDRWMDQLDPSIKKEPWTEEEEIKLFQAYQIYGRHWSKMKKLFPGRPRRAIKDHWKSPGMSKKLDKYKAMLEDSVSSVAISNFCDKNNGEGNSTQDENNITAASEAGASMSETTTDLSSNSTQIDVLTDIDLIVCGSPLIYSEEEDTNMTLDKEPTHFYF